MFVVSAVSPMGPRVQGRREPVGRVTSVSHLAQVFLILGPEVTLPRDTPSTPPTPRQAGKVYHLLKKKAETAMAPHSSTLAWKIPGTGEPGGLPSMGSHRVGHD